jgi:hypothetical protein
MEERRCKVAPGGARTILDVGRPVAEIGHLTDGGHDRARSLSWSASTAAMRAYPPARDVARRDRAARLARVNSVLTMVCEDAACRGLWWESVPGERPQAEKEAAGGVRGEDVFGSARRGDRLASVAELDDFGVEPAQITRQDRLVG